VTDEFHVEPNYKELATRYREERDAFVEGYVAACREWTSGCVPAVTLAYKAWEKVKR
jgi:hypothetical protein